MQLYFDFQGEMTQTLLGGVLGEKMFDWKINPLGLFWNKVLPLNPKEEKDSIIDTILTTLVNSTARLFQATMNTTALVGLSLLSVAGSNLDGFKLLFEDRAIVRDYKTLLQIETKLTQISYYLGKQTRLMATLDHPQALYTVIKKYEDLGLFTGSSDK